MPPPEVVVEKSDASSKQYYHILKMAAILKSNAKYNQRAVIIKGFRSGRSASFKALHRDLTHHRESVPKIGRTISPSNDSSSSR